MFFSKCKHAYYIILIFESRTQKRMLIIRRETEAEKMSTREYTKITFLNTINDKVQRRLKLAEDSL